MKLIRFGEPGRERPGIIDDKGMRRDASSLVSDWTGATIGPEALRSLEDLNWSHLPRVAPDVRLGPCVAGIGKIVCIGLNYVDHARESGMPAPAEPVVFLKAASAIAGPDDDLVLPRGSAKTDWEVELAVVIGDQAKHVATAQALDVVAGYTLTCDYSERAWQLEGTGQWDKGKGYDGFAPLGPWLATPAEIPDPQKLQLWLDVNGLRMQDGSTGNMIFGVAFLVSYVSQFMTLQPGDVICTGTPAGVALGRTPQRYLRTGDRVELGITGLGKQSQWMR
jgi:2-keto-4-pentenoate hydratase/2-oxohepta-3-ene-1,7-dioic acid hydratase in catechol pathway